MLTLKILGFLDDGPLHGYELRRRIVELDGPGSHLSDGALYPALARLEKAGYLVRTEEPGGRGRMRRRVEITTAGRERLHALLRHPDEAAMTSMPRFLTVLAFLSHLPSAAERQAVLRRRLAILQAPSPAFFYDTDGTPRRAAREPAWCAWRAPHAEPRSTGCAGCSTSAEGPEYSTRKPGQPRYEANCPVEATAEQRPSSRASQSSSRVSTTRATMPAAIS